MAKKKTGEGKNGTNANLGFETKLWAAAEDGEPFEEKMKRLTSTLRKQQKEAKLDAAIAANLKELGYCE